jgi:hypothetical protein
MNFPFLTLSRIFPPSDSNRKAELERTLIHEEAEIGGKLFGPVPKGHKRQFFCLDEHTWIWHEEWTEQNGQHRAVTTRYEARPTGVVKLQDGQAPQLLTKNEARNLYRATGLYYQGVHTHYQQRLATI